MGGRRLSLFQRATTKLSFCGVLKNVRTLLNLFFSLFYIIFFQYSAAYRCFPPHFRSSWRACKLCWLDLRRDKDPERRPTGFHLRRYATNGRRHLENLLRPTDTIRIRASKSKENANESSQSVGCGSSFIWTLKTNQELMDCNSNWEDVRGKRFWLIGKTDNFGLFSWTFWVGLRCNRYRPTKQVIFEAENSRD